MKKLDEKQEKELFFYMERELKKLKIIFSDVRPKPESKEVFDLARCYFEDALYFHSKKEYVKTFELLNYTWGLLDALAILNAIKVPKKLQSWFKAEFKKI